MPRGKSGVAWAKMRSGGAVSHWESMWQEWWLVLAALSIILLVLLGLLWLVIEFPGITGWKVVHNESPEGRARQEKWRRDSLVIEQRERRGGKRRGSRVRKVGVDQGVQCLMEVEEGGKREVEENFDYSRLADPAKARSPQTFLERGEELVGLHSPVSTDDEDSGVFPNHHHSKRKERRIGGRGECQPPCKGSSVVIVIAAGGAGQGGGGGGQHQRVGNKDHSVLDSLDLALGPNTAALRPS